ncbi:MAG: DUF1015 family protein [bacterium]|nr:DUF1015 family protein [bacterium]MXZ30152.1 DUF1015 domain-containing protein [Acidimicrobiia bacterium]MYB25380.1 DUF1015 domain-containing protein [Acidimicrobiia bacterium]MYJ14126.1 DUF1015 domain-containing protein [Acidimicrobiia bacterium]
MNAAESAAPGGEPAGHRGSVLWPFSASVVRQDWADRVVSPAYEGLGVEERRSLMLAQPDSYMHATRSPEDVGYALSPAELAVLNQMALIRLLRLGAFESRPAPAVYVYRLVGYGCRQRGIVGVVPLAAYRRGRIRPHERTHADREEMLSEFLALTSAQSSPVGLTFRGTPRVAALLDAVEAGAPPLLDFVDPNEVAQRVWEVTEPAFLEVLNEELEGQNLYVTDGHHRLAAGLVVSERVRRQREASSAAGGYLPSDIVLTTLGHEPPGMLPMPSGEAPGEAPEASTARDPTSDLLASDAILAALFPHDELRLLVFHRRVTPAVATDGAAIEEALGRLGSLEPIELAAAEPPRPGVFGVYLRRRWFRFTPTAGVRGIDSGWLQEHVLAPTFGIDDPEQTRNIEYISAMLGAEQVARRCDESGGVGFVLRPVTIETMMATADARQIMPPKSTYFHPKPRSGVFLRFR